MVKILLYEVRIGITKQLSIMKENHGFFNNDGNLTMINCTFINNKATYSGTIYNTGSNMNIIGSNFTNNNGANSYRAI